MLLLRNEKEKSITKNPKYNLTWATSYNIEVLSIQKN